MKKLLIILPILLMLTGCSNNNTEYQCKKIAIGYCNGYDIYASKYNCTKKDELGSCLIGACYVSCGNISKQDNIESFNFTN